MAHGHPRLLTRRRLLAAAFSCSAASTLAAIPVTAKAAAPEGEMLAPGVLLVRGTGCNVVALRDARGLAFIDGGEVRQARGLLAFARRQLAARAAHTLLNTHWHPEHTGLNRALGEEGARIIAHENTRLWLSTAVETSLDGPVIAPLPPPARPNATTYTRGELQVGEETLEYGYLPQAHTDGDLYVLLRRANVLVTGGVVHGAGWPLVDYTTGGWINGLVAGYRSLLQLCNAETRIVTAHGARLMMRAQLEQERAMLAQLAEQLGKMLRAGFGPEDVVAAAPARAYEERYGDSREFLVRSFRSLWGHMAPDA